MVFGLMVDAFGAAHFRVELLSKSLCVYDHFCKNFAAHHKSSIFFSLRSQFAAFEAFINK
jgi:hypothetical protein